MIETLETSEVLKRVLKSALVVDGVARGLNEAAQTLDKREAHFCVLAKSCDEASFEKLVEDKAELGQMVGQCKYDKDGKARKIVGCSVAVVKDYGRDEEAKNDLQEVLKKISD
ncbi:hypothetical protein niasHS_013092 [Heterodera schachtii]|uniref:40S ribosomal protein S12 n=1 Tax=Heterodera schachtii TaxID=97005 RepID=A0ABD2IUV5_HETSC